MQLNQDQQQKLQNISTRIVKIYEGSECSRQNSSCLNSIRQSLEYLCLFTCEVYDIKITRKTKKGDIVENDNPTLGDMAPLIEKHFKQNNILWSKEVGMHIGSIWIVGNLGSHAQKEMLETDNEISMATIENALNSMYIVTSWFYEHFDKNCPIKPKTSSGVSDEIKQIIEKSNFLYEKLAILKQKYEENIDDNDDNEGDDIDEDDFPDVYFDDLIEAIDLGKCVLFIGPDLSLNDKGKSLHEDFYKKISRRNIEYNEEDGFFMPKAEKQIELKALNYYSKKFANENKFGIKVLKKLAEIPFSLIVSVTPDATMHEIYDEFNIKHKFFYYNSRTKHDAQEPTKENPIIFNMLGNTSADGKYIFTHKQFYDYINQKQDVKIPFEIETKIKDVAHYLFIGLDFNRWYNRLLLFALNLYDEAEAYSFDNQDLGDVHHDFVNKQFNISFIEENYEQFVDVLVSKCYKENISSSLIEKFIENTTEQISDLTKIKVKDELEEKIETIESKIDNLIGLFEG